MLGRNESSDKSVAYRDRAEYATMVMLGHTIENLQAQGKVVSSTLLQSYRDNWTRDGERIDFTHMAARIADFRTLLESTGATDYGALGPANQPAAELEAKLLEEWKRAGEEYKTAMSNRVYYHTIIDPEIREHILDAGAPDNKMRKMFFARQGGSARYLNPGDPVTFTTKSGKEEIYTGRVAGAVAAETTADIEDEAEFDDTSDILIGWDGGEIDGVQYRGLSHIIGAYLTNADANLISKNMDPDAQFSAAVAYNSLELLQHMRSEGYAFNVSKNSPPNQINARMVVGDNVTVRLFDNTDGGKYVGRIYDKFNTYYMDVSGDAKTRNAAVYNDVVAKRALDYVMGKERGKIEKYKTTEASRVLFKDFPKGQFLRIQPSTMKKGEPSIDQYRALKFADADEAKRFIEAGIVTAQGFVDAEFKADEIQALIDRGLDSDDILVSSAEFQDEFEALYSLDPVVREAQEAAVALMVHSDDKGLEKLEELKQSVAGDFDSGFNPAFVIDHMGETDKGNNRDAMMSAMKYVDYDLDKIKGNDFAVNAIKERLIQFDPETAKSIDDIDHPMKKKAMESVLAALKESNIQGDKGYGSDPSVLMDANGVVKWEGHREYFGKSKQREAISGEIGQIMVPDEHGIIKTQFQGESNYGIVPGYTGHFTFDGDYDDRMNRFRVKGYEQHMLEQLQAKVTHQATRPYDKVLEDIPTTLDSSSLNGLYHGDVYGKRIEPDWYETNRLDDHVKDAVLTTLSNRVRFDNQYSDYATTSAETQANRELGAGDDTSAFSYWKAAGETNMRVLGADLENYADLNMTGTGKTQGLIWYLSDGATVNDDGSVTPSEGIMGADGRMLPDKTAVMKLPYFDHAEFDAWDRPQMSSNQIMTAVKVDHKVKTALTTFGGWNLDDGFPISKEMADRNLVEGAKPNAKSMAVLEGIISEMHSNPDLDYNDVRSKFMDPAGMRWSQDTLNTGLELYEALESAQRGTSAYIKAGNAFDSHLETHGVFRPAQRGDKVSDMHGNKGLIGIVIDRDMPMDEAKAQGLEKEVAFMKANPELDMIGSPYSPLSRHNSGLLHEMQSGELSDLIDPDTGKVFEHPVTGELAKDTVGELDVIITDIHVDNKTKAYTADEQGRKASGQLAWALQAQEAKGILDEIYGRNDNAWSTYREYLIATGLDMKADGTVVEGYAAHADEDRTVFQHDADVDSNEFLNDIQNQGGFLETPFELKFKTGAETDQIPVLSSSLRQNVELVDGSMRRSDFTKNYEKIYNAIGDYNNAEDDAAKDKAQQSAQKEFDQIQSTIIDRQFDGGHNGKHSYIREKIMGKRMQNTATAVAVPDPRLDIGVAGMNTEMMTALNAKEGDTVMMFRDPVWRDGAIRAMTVKHDESVHGVSFSPISDKSHDGDFDGDTYGIIKFDSKAANHDLCTKFSHSANMLDLGPGEIEHTVVKDGVETKEFKAPLYFQSGMDFVSGDAAAKAKGDASVQALYDKADVQARSEDPRVLRQAERNLSKYAQKSLREHGFGSEWVSLTDDAAIERSVQRIADSGAKGNPEKAPKEVMAYYRGDKTMDDARDVQYATGVKSDDTGLAGAYSQKLVSVMRNQNMKSATESMYPLTQGTLQIKKSASHARTVNTILTEDMPKVFNAKDLENPKAKSVTPSKFKQQLTTTLTEKMGVDVAETHIDAVTEAVTVNNQIVPLKEAMAIKGSPMDRVAYGGGYEELKRLAKTEQSLLEGENNKLFAPFSMRNADATTKIAKKDTQRVIVEDAMPNFGVDVKKSAVSASSVSAEATAESDSGLVM